MQWVWCWLCEEQALSCKPDVVCEAVQSLWHTQEHRFAQIPPKINLQSRVRALSHGGRLFVLLTLEQKHELGPYSHQGPFGSTRDWGSVLAWTWNPKLFWCSGTNTRKGKTLKNVKNVQIRWAENSHAELKWHGTALGALKNTSLHGVAEGGCGNGVP